MDIGLTHAERAREDGHAMPGGTYILDTEIPRWAFYDIEAHVDWTMRGDRLVIEGIAIWDQIEAEFRILSEADPFDGPLYGYLRDEALRNEADILDAYRRAA
jgi:hypothetical protein